jgi:hypothetical protein
MSKKIIVQTGKKVPISGQYRPSGGNTEYTLVTGKKVPPNNVSKLQKFILVDKTKHKKIS